MSVYPKKELAQLVLQLCEKHGISDVVISPGSRNAPLIIGFVNHNSFKTFEIADERSAAFFALGIAQQTKKPVAVLCTSGSALLNYYPAVAEAYYSKIPLVVISTDRPANMLDIGDGQTIRQANVFSNHILFSANLLEIENEGEQVRLPENAALVREALKIAREQSGPIHINVPLDEPLYATVPELYNYKEFVFQEKQEGKNSLLDEEPLEVAALEKYAEQWNRAEKKMVLVGSNYPDALLDTQIGHLLKDPSVLVFTETISNIHHPDCIGRIDQLISPLTEKEFQELRPDILLTFGGMIVSKKVKQFLRDYKPEQHWHVDKHDAPDTFFCLSKHFSLSPQLFFSQFFFLTKTRKSDYQERWLQVKHDREKAHNLFLAGAPFSDLKAFQLILASLPNKVQLQLGNSSVVRYAQLFDSDPTIPVFCNRGTSGIDGSTSTAVGAAWYGKEQTVFISGDISFFYDSNGLWNSYIKNDFRIILINNGGGGIFRILPGPKDSNVLEYFEYPHSLTAKQLAEMHGFSYCVVNSIEEIQRELESFYESSDKPKLLEILTPSSLNDVVLKEYFKKL